MEDKVRAALYGLGVTSPAATATFLAALGAQGLGVKVQVPDEITHPGTLCVGCDGTLRPYRGEATRAKILDVSGWRIMLHVPWPSFNTGERERERES